MTHYFVSKCKSQGFSPDSLSLCAFLIEFMNDTSPNCLTYADGTQVTKSDPLKMKLIFAKENSRSETSNRSSEISLRTVY